MPKRIPITTAKSVARQHNLSQVLLIGWDGERTHVVTWGKTKADCAAAAQAQDFWTGRIREFSLTPPNQNGGLSSAADNGSVEPLGHEPKTPSPTTPLGAEDLEWAARAYYIALGPSTQMRTDFWDNVLPDKGFWIAPMRAALLALNLPVEPGQ